jgi:hypothetical protein
MDPLMQIMSSGKLTQRYAWLLYAVMPLNFTWLYIP